MKPAHFLKIGLVATGRLMNIKAASKLILLILLGLMFPIKTKAQQTDAYLKFNIKDLLAQQKHKSEANFLSTNTITGKLLYISKGEKRSEVFEYDKVYYILDGKGKFKSANLNIALNPGSIIFIPRGSPHSFYDVEVPLHAFELISHENKSLKDTLSADFALNQVEKARQPNDDVWNEFLKRKSMIFGLYMLPKPLNGDNALTHKWDEVNFVTKGSGKFQVGEKVMDVNAGDIIFVKKGNAHFFHSLNDDLDILIFFEMKSLEKQ